MNTSAVRSRNGVLLKTHRIKKTWGRIVTILAAIVVFCTTYALILPALTWEKQLICTTPAHQHDASCYQEVVTPAVKTLVCEIQEHTHGEACYETVGNLICGMEETTAHVHDAACFDEAGTLICGLEGLTAHTHSEACFDETGALICGLEEWMPHYHTEACWEYTQVLNCDIAEHFHTEECYTETEETVNVELVCGLEEHIHDTACFDAPPAEDPGVYCGYIAHAHNEYCYLDGELTCTIPVHTHTLACESDVNADLETENDWLATLVDVQLSGNWDEDILAVASSQMDYAESERNFIVTPDNKKKGYTRYGQWYGDPYGDWCAMFADFCLNYADIHAFPLDSNCQSWIDILSGEDYQAYHKADEYMPKPGDLVFFDWQEYTDEAERQADHVAIVSEIQIMDEFGNYVPYTGDVETPETPAVIEGEFTDYQTPVEEAVPAEALPEGEAAEAVLAAMPEEAVYPENTEVIENIEVIGEPEIIENAEYAEAAETAEVKEKILPAEDEKLRMRIVTIEGNWEEKVSRVEREFTDDCILGYAELPENPVMIAKAQEAAEAERMMLLAAAEEKEAEKALLTSLSFEGSDFRVEVNFDETANIPDGTVLDVRELVSGSEEYLSYYERLTSKFWDSSVKFCRLFDITFLYEGEEIEPESEVNVVITYDTELPYDEADDCIATVHFTDAGMEELVTELTKTDGGQSFEFDQGSFSVTGNLLLAATPVTATYYQRVDSITDTNADYLLISVNGNYALTAGADGATTSTGTAVKLSPVKGNPGYFTISSPATINNNILWRFGSTVSGTNTNGENTTIRRGTSGIYLYQTRSSNQHRLFSATEGNERVIYNSGRKVWRIRGTATNETNRYVTVNNSGTFSPTDGATQYSDFIILKVCPNTTLQIPEDVAGGGGGGGGGQGEHKEQPTYEPDAESISNKKTGSYDNTAVKSIVTGAKDTITGGYASDKATSNIESRYFSTVIDKGTPDELNPTVNDGRVDSDKSVIYGHDDYGAFASYDPGTFSVTLSSLGQDYQIKEESQVKIPVDIVFVLDVSGSMINNNTSEGITRTQAVVNAVNTAAKTITAGHEENRIGVVLYSSGGSTLLPLDHYTDRNNQPMDIVRFNTRDTDIYTANNLYGAKQGQIASTNAEVNGFTQAHGTYTQYGIALGADLLLNNADTTYTATLNEGTEYERDVTVVRQPVVILLSDGDPTHCTNNYMDVLNGPHYGSGVYTNENNKGIQGYYTILSANYYKRMVGIHYDTPATMYTIGMGIYESGVDDMSKQSYTGDHYKRAVLNPTTGSISDLSLTSQYGVNVKNRTATALMLQQLLGNSYNNQSVSTGTTTQYTNIGDSTHQYVPVDPNPYSPSEYAYADGAYFGELATSDLEEIFADIIKGTTNVKDYGFILYKNTHVTLNDAIGEGMEVLDVPVLRYNGVNYACTGQTTGKTATGIDYTSYTYNYVAFTKDNSSSAGTPRRVDLSGIKVYVYEDTPEAGMQNVTMQVPEECMPSYTPDSVEDWYYEELPVRLIYQVGLTAEAKAEVQKLAPGKTVTYYTNAFVPSSEITDGTELVSYSDHEPDLTNPYYYDIEGKSQKRYADMMRYKSENTTNTLEFYDWDIGGKNEENIGNIYAVLGNNGLLTFTNEAPNNVDVDLEKQDMDGHLIANNPAIFDLYSDAELKNKIGTYQTDKDGKLTFTDLTTDSVYYLKETKAPDGYELMVGVKVLTLDEEGKLTVADGDTYVSVNVDGTLVVKNNSGVELPSTTGIPYSVYYALGASLLVLAIMGGLFLRRRQGRRRDK